MISGSYAYDWLYLGKELIGRGLSGSSLQPPKLMLSRCLPEHGYLWPKMETLIILVSELWWHFLQTRKWGLRCLVWPTGEESDTIKKQQYNTIQYNTIQYNTIQYNTIYKYIYIQYTILEKFAENAVSFCERENFALAIFQTVDIAHD